MADAISIVTSGMKAAQEDINTISHNAANAKSLAFKENILITSDNFYTTLKKGGLVGADNNFSRPAPLQRGYGSKISAKIKNMTQGPQKATDNPLDLYINGGGYFAVNIPNVRNGVGYTRVGAFRINSNRDLVTAEGGYTLTDDINIPQDVPADHIEITDDGLIRNKNTLVEYGQITLTTFPNELGLELKGSGIALETETSGAAIDGQIPGVDDSVGTCIQGALEDSNVSQIEALTALIGAQRAYELNLKIASAQNEILKETNKMGSS
jgi:flagellar basal-body rod protein FlgG